MGMEAIYQLSFIISQWKPEDRPKLRMEMEKLT